MPKIRGGKVKGIASLRKSVKRSSGEGAITRIPKDAPLVVRFADEPDEWFEFFTHWDESKSGNNKSSICVTSDCEGCADGLKQTKRFLANAIDVDNSKIVAVELPVTLVKLLLNRYDKYHTVMDRDYELTKNGTGKDTEYDAISEGKSRFNFDMYEKLDLSEILAEQTGGDDDDDDDEDEPLPAPKKSTSGTKRTGGSLRRAPKPPVDDDEDEDEPPFDGGKRIAKRTVPRNLPGKTLNKDSSTSTTGKTLGKATPAKVAPKKLLRK